MIIDDLLEGKKYDDNVGAKFLYDSLFTQYQAVLNKAQFSVVTKQEKLQLLFMSILKSYCALIVQDINNPMHQTNSIDYEMRWKYKLLRLHGLGNNLEFDKWFGGTTNRKDSMGIVDLHSAINAQFNYQNPVSLNDKMLAEISIGIDLLTQ